MSVLSSLPNTRLGSPILLVRKKNGQIRCYIDFRDLTKTSPKTKPTSNIDRLVNAIASNSMFSFMDDFSSYNHIEMVLQTLKRPPYGLPWGISFTQLCCSIKKPVAPIMCLDYYLSDSYGYVPRLYWRVM